MKKYKPDHDSVVRAKYLHHLERYFVLIPKEKGLK